MKDIRLSDAPLSFKVLVSFFLLAVAIGYVFGLIHIYSDVGLSYTGILTHYRGSRKVLTTPPEFAFARLVHVHHVHIFGISLLFFLVGILFTLTQLPETAKAIFVAIPFIGMFLDFSSFWLLVFVSPVFAFFGMAFGALMALSFFLIVGRPLYEMWALPLWHHLWREEKVPWFLK